MRMWNLTPFPNKCLHVFFISSVYKTHSVCTFYLFSVSVQNGTIFGPTQSFHLYRPNVVISFQMWSSPMHYNASHYVVYAFRRTCFWWLWSVSRRGYFVYLLVSQSKTECSFADWIDRFLFVDRMGDKFVQTKNG